MIVAVPGEAAVTVPSLPTAATSGAWVDSKVIDAVYSEVPKSSIPDPLTFASLSGRFMRMTTAAAEMA